MDKEGRIADIKVCPKAGILLDAIPALGDKFSYSIFESWIWIENEAPRPSQTSLHFNIQYLIVIIIITYNNIK